MGRDEGGREGDDEGGATKDGASTDMPRDASDGRVSGLVASPSCFLLRDVAMSKKIHGELMSFVTSQSNSYTAISYSYHKMLNICSLSPPG